ncbi:MAG: Ig-like domain-containing protein, partial [Opitutaceae bacterium]
MKTQFLSTLFVFLSTPLFSQSVSPALVRHAPVLNGTVAGSVQMLVGESVNLNSTAKVSGDLLVPGTPTVVLNGMPSYGGTQNGSGANSPSNYSITLSSGSTLGHVVRRTDPVVMAAVPAPTAPTGNRSVSINSSNGNPGDFATLRNLTLNSNVGLVAVPAGSYGNFSANSGAGFILGVAGATIASTYSFQNLTVNEGSIIRVVGPVMINLASGLAGNGSIGDLSNLSWLKLNLHAGSFTLNSGCTFYGSVNASNAKSGVTINADSRLVGALSCDSLTVNNGGVLQLASVASNLPPTISMTSPISGAVFTAAAGILLEAAAADIDGAVTKVEFFQGATLLGEDTIAPYRFSWSNVAAGSYVVTARATDNTGATSTSGPVTVNVNAPPSAVLIAPENNAVFDFPATVALQAVAIDPDGSVAGVEFYAADTFLGEVGAPYRFIWTNAAPGSYALTARVTDNLGAMTTSNTVAVVINSRPTVALIAPRIHEVGSAPASFWLRANASDDDGTIAMVDFYSGTTKIGMSATAPYQFAWNNVSTGSYSLTAVATDNRGATATSLPIVVRVDPANVAPLVVLTTPTNGTLFHGLASFTLAAAASDPDGAVVKVRFYRDANLLGDSTTAPFQFAVSDLGPGSYSFSAQATDNSGAVTTSAAVSVLVNALPTVTMNSPVSATEATAPARFVLSAMVSDPDGSVIKVEFFQDSTKLATRTALPYTFEWDGVPAGSYLLTAVTTDDRGGITVSSPRSVEVSDNVPPSVALVSPAEGAVVVPPAAISFTAAASDADGTVVKVEFFESERKLGEAIAPPFAFTWLDVPSGNYRLLAKATDNLGASVNSVPVNVTVNAPPIAEAQNLSTSADTALTVTLTGSDLETPASSLSFEIVVQPAHGVLSGPAPNLQYTPTAGFLGSDTFTFRVFDGTAFSPPGTVELSINYANLPPAVNAGTDQRIGVSAGDGRNQIVLTGEVTDDGQPNPPGDVSQTWTQTSGPQPVVIDNPNSLTTAVHFGTGGPGKGLHFSAAADSVLLPSTRSFHPAPAFSWEMWFRCDDVPTGTGNSLGAGQTMICAADRMDGQDIYLGFGSPFSPSRALSFVVDDEASQDNDPLSYYPVDGFQSGGWYHVVATRDYANQRTRLYVNGVLRGENSSAKSPIGRSMTMSFGRWWDSGNLLNHFVGTLDEVRIYDRELTAEEAAEHYGQGLGQYGGMAPNLVGGWHFDEPNDLPPADFSNAARSVSLTGSPTSIPGIVPEGGVIEAPGIYTFRLSASDGAATASDDIVVTVNTAPKVFAGENQTILNLAQGALLSGTVVDDNVPSGTPAIEWRVVDGPGQVEFATPHAVQTHANFSSPGIYILKLFATDGWIDVSDFVEVRVAVGSSVEPATGIAAWWPANGESHEVVQGNHDVAFQPKGVIYGPGKVSQAFVFDGGDVGQIPAHTDLDIGASPAGLTIELWVKAARVADGQWLVRWSGSTAGVGLQQNYDGTGWWVYLRDTAGLDHLMTINGGVFPIGTWIHVALTYDRVTGVARMYKNGTIIKEQTVGIFTPQTAQPLYLGQSYQGALDEIALYTRALTLAEVQAIYQAGADGKSLPDDNAPPTVDAGPDIQLLSVAGTAMLGGVVIDDGKPAGGILTMKWSQVEGPGTAIFENENSPNTGATFTVPGIYLLRLDASDGLHSAAGDTVEVRVGVVTNVEPVAGLVAWWPANGALHEVVRGNHDVEFVPKGVTYELGKVSQAFVFDGGDVGRIPAHGELDIGASPFGLTVELWVKAGRAGDGQWLVRWAGSTAGVGLQQNYAGIGWYVYLRDTDGMDHTMSIDGGVFPIGTWIHIAMTYDRTAGIARMYKNGVLIKEQMVGVFTPQTAQPLYFGQNFQGALDEITLYSRALTLAEVQAIYQAGSSGKSPVDDNTPPSVDAGPDVQVLSTADLVALNGRVVDDGKPTGGVLTMKWTQVEGPGAALFTNPNADQTTATFTAPGLYVLRLDANDGLQKGLGDTMEVRVGTVGNIQAPPGIAAWWPANGEFHEVVRGGHDVEFLPKGVAYGIGKVSQAFLFDGGDVGRIAAHGDLDIGASPAGFTVELWVNAARAGDGQWLLRWSGSTPGVGLQQNYAGTGWYVYLRDTAGLDHTLNIDGGVFSIGEWVHLALTYDRVAGVARMYKNGALIKAQTIGVFMPQTAQPLYLGQNFQGALDEITFYTRPLNAAEIQTIYSAGGAGKSWLNTGPTVNAGPDFSAKVGVPLMLGGLAVDDGRPNPPSVLTYLWTQTSGPGVATFSTLNAASTSVIFDLAGTYNLRLSASDSALNGSDDVSVIVAPATPPVVSLTAPANNTVVVANVPYVITATANDADGDVTQVEFFDGATKLGEDATAPYSLTIPSGFSAGAHSLTAKATDNDGLTSTTDPISIVGTIAASLPPTISIFEPGPSVGVGVYFEIAATATDPDGTIEKVEFFQGETKLGEQTLPQAGHPTTYFWPMNAGLSAGTYSFAAIATDDSGARTISAPVTVVASGSVDNATELFIATPDEDSRISAPSQVAGVISAPGLTSWILQYRLRPPGDDTTLSAEPWLVAATGNSAIGTAATSTSAALPGIIGSFDPTFLVNGLYELRVQANTVTSMITTPP